MGVSFGTGDILFQQRLLKSAGFYQGALDGLWGPQSRAAAVRADQAYAAMRQDSGTLDVRSERNIATLLPKMQDLARRIMKIARGREDKTKLYAVVLSGTRTYAEQDGLYAQKPKVTNARGGQSNHNFGIAIDIGLFKDGKYLTGNTKAEEQAYADLAKAVKLQLVDVDWGGDWATFKDMPHYEYKTGLTIAQKRAKFEKGQLTL